MSNSAAIAALGFGLLAIVTLLLVLQAIGSGIRRRNIERREVDGPEGVWSTRIHWTHPKGGLGVAARVFERREATEDDANEETKEERFRLKWSDLFDLGEIFDPAFLMIAGLVATVGLVVSGFVIVLLAIELAFFFLLFAILTSARVFLRHPWTIEVIDPRGRKQLVDVEGLRATRETQIQIREQIASGTLRLIPLGATEQS